MAEEVENAIRQNAQGPESAEVDGVKVRQHSLPDQIAADKYLAGKAAAQRNPARAFARWAKAIGLPEKLRTTGQARNEKKVHKDDSFSQVLIRCLDAQQAWI